MARWSNQNLSGSLLDFLEETRKEILRGDLNIREWDHNHPNHRSGLSNKRLIIAGRMLLGRDPVDVEEAWQAVCQAIGIK